MHSLPNDKSTAIADHVYKHVTMNPNCTQKQNFGKVVKTL